MTLPKKITVRLGTLRPAIQRQLKKTGETASEYTRRLWAEDLDKPVPRMKQGNPNFKKKK